MTSFLLAAWLGACAADATTTHLALNRGAYERFLTQNPYANDVIIAGQAAGFGVLLVRLHTRHPRLALALGAAVTTVRLSAAAHNGIILAGGIR